MQNPEMFRSMMENPFVQQMMSNPEIMRRLITSNPQMRELMEVSLMDFFTYHQPHFIGLLRTFVCLLFNEAESKQTLKF